MNENQTSTPKYDEFIRDVLIDGFKKIARELKKEEQNVSSK